MQKISNSFLTSAIEVSVRNPSYSLKDCAEELKCKSTTLYNWYRNLKTGKWPKNYSKTEDQIPLDEKIVDKFISSFAFSQNSAKILKKMVTKKCLSNSFCYAKQHKILKRLFKKYPNIDFWLHVDFGEARDDILFYIGKNEQNLHRKYLDFTNKDVYTEFKYEYKPEEASPKTKKRKNLWDFY